ncbi:alpha/beta hydrolase [Saccharothrix sp. ST-888]|uniref:alpha/beta hydrolase n=1 Tax=Saccharothrix sp. ST-888 TaxID=1427391 RepID=UPI0006966F23|nr:alpha/beta hydrolase-fold protein [Saccharothrix sp. ST-888]
MADFDETDLQLTLTNQVNNLTVGPAPFEAIVREGGRIRRRRYATRAALTLGVAGAMVSGLILVQSAAGRPSPTTPTGPGPAAEVPAVSTGPTGAGLAGTGGTAGRTGLTQSPATKEDFRPAQDLPGVPNDVLAATVKGPASGVEGQVLVWLPPQYDDPAYQGRTFPVIELLPGFPGSPAAWFGAMQASEQLKGLIADHGSQPFILVAPQTSLSKTEDPGCADVPGKVKAETWLTQDVPQLVLNDFRADPAAERWSVAGYSAGAHCATRLGIGHPDRFHAVVGISGFNDPGTESSSVVAKDPKLRESANPLNMLRSAAQPPHVSLYEAGAAHDGLEDAEALKDAATSPTTVTVVKNTASHTLQSWRGMVSDALRWLSQQTPEQR